MNTTKLSEPDLLTEVPESLKRLIRYIARGFYTAEHAIIIDMLVHHPCIKEDDLCDLIKFERKALRGLVNTLKTDRFVKARTRIETSEEGRQTHHSYYFINYSSFVNVVKYKLDHMRKKKKVPTGESTSRASFKCPGCTKMFTDLEADQLFDFVTSTFRCTYCQSEVEEEASSLPRKDARTLMVKFNEQMEPLFGLLKEVEDVKLAPSILEPEPMEFKPARESRSGGSTRREGAWSGDTSRTVDYNFQENQVTIEMEGQDRVQQVQEQLLKERPVWMVESTIEGANEDSNPFESTVKAGASQSNVSSLTSENDEVMKTLLAHETKSNRPKIPGLGKPVGTASDEDTTSSESEDDFAQNPTTSAISAIVSPTADEGGGGVEEMADEDEEEDEDESFVTIGHRRVPYDEVTEEMVAQMTPTERDLYIKIGQEMYQDMYE